MMIIENPNVLESVLVATPFDSRFEGEAGDRWEHLSVEVHEDGGLNFSLREAITDLHAANHVQDHEGDAPDVRSQLAGWDRKIVGITVRAEHRSCFETKTEHTLTESEIVRDCTALRLPTMGNGDRMEFFIPMKPLDWKAIRRRIEDRLRKDDKALRQCAAVLDVKIY